jgi:hypothetical protein
MVLTATIVALVLGTPLAFGGVVWWAAPFVAVLSVLLVLASLAKMLLEGTMRLLKSPLTVLGVLALGLAVVQLAPLPAPIAARLSPNAQAAYSRGVIPSRLRADDPAAELPEPAAVRSPATLDRSATLRWLAGASACLALFWGVSQFTDRLRRLYLVWGCVVVAFCVNTAFALVQISCQSGGLYGMFLPGKGPGPFWAPSVDDLMNTPNRLALRPLGLNPELEPDPQSQSQLQPPPAWALALPDQPFLFGSLMGGAGAYLALGALGLPLGLAVVFQLLAPRGSRVGLRVRLAESGQGSLVVLLYGLLLGGAVLVGLMAGPVASLPFALGLGLVGVPAARPTGLRWTAVALTLLVLLFLGGGVFLGDLWSHWPGARPPVGPVRLTESAQVWSDALAIIADFPILGTGLGSFAAVDPFYKSRDAATTSALSSLLQWWVESGAVGLVLLLTGGAWCLFRLPGAVRRVGTADRALVFGLIGAAASFSLFSVIHWTVELSAVAMAASAWGGTWNRWLAGGTDLFVERG